MVTLPDVTNHFVQSDSQSAKKLHVFPLDHRISNPYPAIADETDHSFACFAPLKDRFDSAPLELAVKNVPSVPFPAHNTKVLRTHSYIPDSFKHCCFNVPEKSPL